MTLQQQADSEKDPVIRAFYAGLMSSEAWAGVEVSPVPAVAWPFRAIVGNVSPGDVAPFERLGRRVAANSDSQRLVRQAALPTVSPIQSGGACVTFRLEWQMEAESGTA